MSESDTPRPRRPKGKLTISAKPQAELVLEEAVPAPDAAELPLSQAEEAQAHKKLQRAFMWA